MVPWTGLEGTMLFAALLIAGSIQTVVLAASIWMLAGAEDHPFRDAGQFAIWGKCAGLMACVTLLSLLPYGGWIAMATWYFGIMIVFNREFGEALMILIVNIAIALIVIWLLTQAFN
ncbi:MAG: hypothetical protein IID30_11610 [Planctomycetes bacterium]|nr:hypothetical protein [Planctomycetota bacterium]